MNELLGMRIRNGEGRGGRITAFDSKGLQVEWLDETVLFPTKESLSVAGLQDEVDLQVLTLTEGWKSMSDVMREMGTAPKSLLEDLEGLLTESSLPLEEATKKGASGKGLEKKARETKRSKSKEGKRSAGHNPFKNKSRLGPGPRHGTNAKQSAWKCSCASPYKCLCRGKGGKKKTIKIKKNWKRSYNSEYKQFRKNQKH
jgi:hypothetical protein